ncbi:MAG: NTP transferase domain-containing protein [Cyclobacteriaceae bacterium]
MTLTKQIVDITRHLRSLQTAEEKQLWEKLRNRKLKGIKFLRQHPIVYGHRGNSPLFFVADFYCNALKLVIELDGKVHKFQKDYDANRDSILKQLGLKVLRIENEELVNLESVLKRISEFLTHPPSPSLQSREGVSSPDKSGEDGGELNKSAILILAAGSSSRMGQSKQQLLIDGQALLFHTVAVALQSSVRNISVVLGSRFEEHREILKGKQVDIIFNANWKTGIGSSIKTGLRHLLSKKPKTEAAIIMVCDQPLLRPQHLKMLFEKHHHTKATLVASAYSGTVGVPALFASRHFDEILELKDDEGAKKIIHQYPIETIDFPEGAIDLDTPEDYKKFLHTTQKKCPDPGHP